MKRKLIILTLLIAIFSMSNIFSQQWNPRPGWKDSFKANGFCWCESNYDHGITNKKVEINGTLYGVKKICEELKKHPQYRNFRNGDIPYNDIQCGNGPYNDAPDEPGCPGRVDIGPAGCNQIGPKWDMAWLRTRTIFNGNGGGDGGGNGNGDNGEIGTAGTGGSGVGQGPKLRVIFPTLNKRFTAPANIKVLAEATDQDGVKEVEVKIDGVVVRKERVAPYEWNQNGQDNLLTNLGVKNYLIEVKAIDNKGNASIVDILIYVEQNSNGGDGNNSGSVTVKGQSINKYISSENGNRSMRANRSEVGSGEKFTVQSSGNGTVSFKGNNGKYVSSENGKKAMNCNRNAVGAWEKFKLESLGGDLYAIKGNNGKYVSHENGRNMGIFCNRNAVGAWEKFIIKGLNPNRVSTVQNSKPLPSQSVTVYPNPIIKGEDVHIQINVPQDVQSFVEIMDLNGRSITKSNLGILKAGTRSVSVQDLENDVKTNGLYLLKITLGKNTIVKQLMIE